MIAFCAAFGLACGGDDGAERAADAGPTPGSASVNGTADHWTLDPVSVLAGLPMQYVFVRTFLPTVHHEVIVADFADHCGNDSLPFGRVMYFDLFDDPSAPDSRVREPGAFAAWVPTIRGSEIPTDRRVVAVLSEQGSDGGIGVMARSGTVTITSVDASRIEGTFDLNFSIAVDEFGTQNVTGLFDAPLCKGEWHRGGNIP